MYGQYESDCCGAWCDESNEICSHCGEHCVAVWENHDDDGQPDLYTEAQDYFGGDDNPADYCDFFQTGHLVSGIIKHNNEEPGD